MSLSGEALPTQILVTLTPDADVTLTTNSDDGEVFFVSARRLDQPILSTGPSVHSSDENALIGRPNIQTLLRHLSSSLRKSS